MLCFSIALSSVVTDLAVTPLERMLGTARVPAVCQGKTLERASLRGLCGRSLPQCFGSVACFDLCR